METSGQLVDTFSSSIYPAAVSFEKGRITSVRRLMRAPSRYLMPGFVDAHVHIESSMLIPSEFSRIAIRHGTVSVVADPHEIGNVLGMRGFRFMVRNSRKAQLKFHFGAPSCVPATGFETAGAKLGRNEIDLLMSRDDVLHLSEVMNYPAVINREPEVMAKIASAKKRGKRVDGHAPGLRGVALDKYISAGIETDHECYLLDEAMEKISKGMKVIVREGSAAKNLSVLHPALGKDTMLCSDDRHPDDLVVGHMDAILRKCVSLGVDPMVAIQNATRNPIEHYGLDVGLLRVGDPADFVIVKDLSSFKVQETWIDGEMVFGKGRIFSKHVKERPINNFHAKPKSSLDFAKTRANPIIGAIEGEIITDRIEFPKKRLSGPSGLNKIAVVNRYKDAPPATAFISGFGLKTGAFGSSVMHDSHNIGVVGADDRSICEVVNTIIRYKGGLVVHDGKRTHTFPLPFAGLMQGGDGENAAKRYKELTALARRTGCPLKSPFMTLSFMALLVIPHLKLSDRGLFDGDRFGFVD